MKTLFCILILTVFSSSGNAQFIEQWTQSYNGTGNYNDAATSIAIDESKNVFVTGYSYGAGTLNDYALIKYNATGVQQWVNRYNGPGNDNDNVNAIVMYNSDIYITGQSFGSGTSFDYATIKYNSSGVQLWAARYNGTSNSNDGANAIAVDDQGNVYVTGESYGGTATSYDFTTVKYNSSGNQIWAIRYNGPGNGNDGANAITVDQYHNIYITGESFGSGTNLDYTTIKYNSSGEQQWIARYNGTANDIDISKSISVNNAGEVIVTGYSRGSGTSLDYATIKYDSLGTELWVSRYNGTANGSDIPSSMAVNSTGDIYLTGVTNTDVSGSLANYATLKYNAAGNIQWIAVYNGTGNNNDSATSLTIDDSGNVFVTGKSIGSGTSFDFATIKYNSAGSPQYVARFNNSGSSKDVANAVTLDNFGNTYVAGGSTLSGSSDDFLTVKYSKISGINTLSSVIPERFELYQNYPNPFNPVTNINYSISKSGFSKIKIYDVIGNEVTNLVSEFQNPGTYSVQWNAENNSSGIYYYTLENGIFNETKKMILIK
jgi:hypothetical protein